MTVVRNEFESGENNPTGVLFKRIMSTAYDWHNYGNLPIGARSDIEGVPIERLQAFYRTYYQPDNAVLLVAGKIDEATTLALVQQYFGAIPRPTRASARRSTPSEPVQDGERQVTLRRTGDVQMAADRVSHAAGRARRQRRRCRCSAQVLGDSPSGRLYKALVETGKAPRGVLRRCCSFAIPAWSCFGAQVRAGQAARRRCWR